MNPLLPSPRLLRRIARAVGATDDRAVVAWVEAMRALPQPKQAREFVHVSVVRTFRAGRFAGFEVWRHLASYRVDPTRKKARLWFGRPRYGVRGCLAMARAAARRMEQMTQEELRAWWAAYQEARGTRAPVTGLQLQRESADEESSRYIDRLDFHDLRQMSHVYTRDYT